MSDVIQFECGACRTSLTVPSHMAGISGPCPTCGQTVTSPAAPPPPAAPSFGFGMPPAHAPAPQWAPPPMAPPPPAPMMAPMGGFQDTAAQMMPPASPPGFGQAMLGGLPADPSFGGGSPTGTSLPPRRAPGQVPMSASPPGAPPAWSPPSGGLGLGLPPNDPASPMPGAPAMGNPATQSRLIPGAPMIPSMPGGAGGMTSSLPAGSLLGRDVPAQPVTPATQALAPNGAFPNAPFGGGMSTLPQSAVAPASPLPAGRNLAALRPNRGTNFIRLALAAVFMLGFLGLAAYFLKDTITGYLGTAEDVPEVKETTPPASIASIGPATDEPKVAGETKKPSSASALPESKPQTTTDPLQGNAESSAADSTKPLMGTVANLEDTPVRKAEPATPAELAMVKGTTPTDPPSTTGTAPMVSEESSTGLGGTTPPKIPEAAPGAPTPRDATAGGLDDKPSEKVPSEAEPALKTLKAFLASSSAEERATHVLGADLMKPLLDRYYSRNNDGPITVDHISFGRYDKQPDLGTGAHCIFHIESKTWEYPVPAMLEEQADGWKVDWLTFIELKDRKLEEFFKTYQEGKAAFHVGIFRQHYFGDEVPNRDQKDAFSIGLPRPNPFRAPVFLSKDAELARQLRERLPWEVHVWAIVELEWKKLGSQQWVELVSMPQMHWYSVPAAPRPISTSEKPPAEAPSGGELLPPGIKRSPAGSAPTIQKATPVPDQAFPPGIKRSPATRGR